MRVCVAGQQTTDPCNVKDDTLGCYATMGTTFPPGFSFTNSAGQVTTFDKPKNVNSNYYVPKPIAGKTATPTVTATGSGVGPTAGSGPDSQSFGFRATPILAMLTVFFL